jgi:hypothetical protein
MWDNILRESIPDCYADQGFQTVCTNPCSEIPLSAYDSCRLMLLNAYSYVDRPFMSDAEFNYMAFFDDAYMLQRLMDDMVDLELECIDRILAKIQQDPEAEELKFREISLWRKVRLAAENGRRTGGDNFRDLSLVLWRELRGIRDPEVRRGLLARVGSAMAGAYRDRMTGETPAQRLENVAEIFRERRLSCSVEPEATGGLPVLTTYSCPYPELAEQDRGICAAERIMLEELVGTDVQLSECRLDGASCCRFTASAGTQAT